jgi:hypothetical protein
MPTFRKKPEIVDARQFTGGVQNGTDLAFWVSSNDCKAMWYDVPDEHREMVTLYFGKFQWKNAYIGDWIILNQDGSFSAMRPEDFESTYDQV